MKTARILEPPLREFKEPRTSCAASLRRTHSRRLPCFHDAAHEEQEADRARNREKRTEPQDLQGSSPPFDEHKREGGQGQQAGREASALRALSGPGPH